MPAKVLWQRKSAERAMRTHLGHSARRGEAPPRRADAWTGVEPVLSMRTYRDIDIRSLDHEPRADRRRRCRQDDRMSISRYGRIESTGFTPVQVSARRGGASPPEDLCTTMRPHRALSTFALPDALSPSRRWHAKLMRSDSFSMMTSDFEAPSSTDRSDSPIRSGLSRTATSDGAS